MHFSPPKLHPPVLTTDEDRDLARRKVEALLSRRPKPTLERIGDGSRFSIPLTTVSQSGSFDSHIQVQCPISGGAPVSAALMLDSGNATLIFPHGEQLTEANGYTVLGHAYEPWECPANVVQGPIQIPTSNGYLYEIKDCVFYACIGNNPAGKRTANFGLGCLSPWSSNKANKPLDGIAPLQSPLSYGKQFPYVEVVYAPAETMFSDDGTLSVTDGSLMTLHSVMPTGYTSMKIIPGVEYMSVIPTSLTIGGMPTTWPGGANWNIIAMIDTGGSTAYLSDPNSLVYNKTWPDPATCPVWAQYPTGNCFCIGDRLEIGLAQTGGSPAYRYTIDTGAMPPSVQGLTLVMCESNPYMWGWLGMNTGGITALFNYILIDYANAQVGLAPKYPKWPQLIEMAASVNQPLSLSRPGVLLGYDFYEGGSVVSTTMTVSWTGLPAGATLHLQHGGSAGAEVLYWNGPDSSTEPSGELSVNFGIHRSRGQGPAVPVFIFVPGDAYWTMKLHLKATTT